MPTGRPTKLTPEVQTSICRDLAAGLTRDCAATRAGITYSTLRLWVSRGRRGGAKNTAFLDFYTALKKAEQDAIARNVAIVQTAAKGGMVVERVTSTDAKGRTTTTEKFTRPEWTAGAWWLERKFPDRWGKRERREVTGKKGGPIQHEHEHTHTIDADLAPYADAIRILVRGGLGPYPEDVPQDSAAQPVYQPQTNGKASHVPPLSGS